ncbi:MAG: hypothetical protein A2521_12350 [Deltaproteobacteria bacterium RIFOXYD12_FULL_57_12]|nr:MAG: hypothetical protein A2521_12350 [Deltaproteobacteria bacterium RIFOXYD12_FULL_57_12]
MKLILLPVLLMCLFACAAGKQIRLPELTAIEDVRVDKGCEAIFPRGSWQFVHAIDFSMQDGSGGTVIGVTSLAGDEIACALMTIEGFTLFEAAYSKDEGLEVRRAVPPFDKPAFAAGLLEDVRVIFLAPAAENVRYGWLTGNAPVCRYAGVDGRTTDILPAADDCWQIKTYTSKSAMNRAIVGRSCQKRGNSLIPEYIELRGFNQANYTLKMTLIQAENLGAVTR